MTIALAALVSPILLVPVQAQSAADGCTPEDPRIAEVVVINGNKPLKINRRKKKVSASVGDPICKHDRTLRHTVDVEIRFDENKEQVKIPKGSVRDFTGAKATSFVSAGKSAAADLKLDALVPVSVDTNVTSVAIGDDARAATTIGSIKPVVGVYLFDDLTGSGQAEAFSSMIETAIIASNKFRVIERSQLDKLIAEQGLIKDGVVRSFEARAIEGVDYLIYGSITDLSVRDRNLDDAVVAAVMGVSLVGACPSKEVVLGSDIRITDALTGEVKYATTANQSMRSKAICDESESKIDISPLLRDVSKSIATQFVTTIFPIQVADVQVDSVVTLNYGSGTVKLNEYYNILQRGAAIRDPANGTIIGNVERKIATIQITEVFTMFSRGIVIDGDPFDIAVGSVARLTPRPRRKPAE